MVFCQTPVWSFFQRRKTSNFPEGPNPFAGWSPLLRTSWFFGTFPFSQLRDSASSFHWLTSSIFSVWLFVRSSSRIGDISSHLHYMMFHSIQTIYFLWSWQHVSANISNVVELSPVYCCPVSIYKCQAVWVRGTCSLVGRLASDKLPSGSFPLPQNHPPTVLLLPRASSFPTCFVNIWIQQAPKAGESDIYTYFWLGEPKSLESQTKCLL